MSRLGIKVVCLAVAIVVWIQVAANTEMEQTLLLPLELTNLAEGYTLVGNDIPPTVQVRSRGSKLRLLAHQYFNQHVGSVVVDLGGAKPGAAIQREITINDVRSDLDILSVTPRVQLLLRIDRQVARRVPVAVITEGQLPAGLLPLAPPAARPDSVDLVGPSRFFRGGEQVQTEPVVLDKVRQSITRRQRLVSPSPYLVPTVPEVEIRILVAARVARTFANLPVIPLVDADQPEVTIYPPVADLVCSGPEDSIKAVEPSRSIAVTISASGLPEGIHHLSAQVDKPEWMTFVSIEPETFMVIVGDVGPDRPQTEEP